MTFTLDRFPDGYATFALYSGDRPVLAIGGTVLREPLPSPRADPYQILSGRSGDLGLIPNGPHPWRDLSTVDVLPCALVMHPNYETFPVGPGAADPAVLDAFVLRLRAWAESAGLASLAFLYVTPAGAALLDALRRHGADVVALSAACVLDVSWPDFAGYLAMLPSKRRIEAKRELRHLAERGVTVGEEPFPAVADELLALRGRLVAKYGGAPSAERDRRLLRHLATAYRPDELCVVTARRGGKLLGFMLFAADGLDGSAWTALLTGADYDDPDSRFTYFATAFYRPAGLAARRGVRRVSYGFGSWEAKRLRGCRLVPVHAAALRLASATAPDRGVAASSGVGRR
jgi:uncharacterized protein